MATRRCQLQRQVLVYQLAGRLLDWLYPPRCRLCGAASAQSHALCRPCQDELPWLHGACPQCARPLGGTTSDQPCGRCQRQPPAFDHTQALFHYHPPVDFLLKRLKFSGELALGPLLGGLLTAQLAQRRDALPQLLVPVPLHPARQRARGFNQAIELARCASREFDIPLDHRLCRRARDTGPQSLLPWTARRLNLRNAFAVHGHCPAHVAIVDDVMTSGHTANELARTLRQAGAQRVEVWVIARAGPG
jgi:ComF family protein